MNTLRSLFGRHGLLTRAPAKPGRIQRVEGARGMSLRASVYLRYLAYVIVIVLASSVSNFCFTHIGKYTLGGVLMFGLATLTFVTAAAGTMFYTNQRNEILEQCRHYVFGMMVLPGTAIALIMYVAQLMAGTGQQAQNDQFLHIIFIGLPAVYFATVVLPPVLFVKMLAGIRNLHRSQLDDEEMVSLWTRQDGLQR